MKIHWRMKSCIQKDFLLNAFVAYEAVWILFWKIRDSWKCEHFRWQSCFDIIYTTLILHRYYFAYVGLYCLRNCALNLRTSAIGCLIYFITPSLVPTELAHYSIPRRLRRRYSRFKVYICTVSYALRLFSLRAIMEKRDDIEIFSSLWWIAVSNEWYFAFEQHLSRIHQSDSQGAKPLSCAYLGCFILWNGIVTYKLFDDLKYCRT